MIGKVKRSNKNVEGITLIALIITVIVMLILASVAINLTIGDNGIFKKADDARIIHENASLYEQLGLKVTDYELTEARDDLKMDILYQLKAEGCINEDNSVNVAFLERQQMKTGKGKMGEGDIYVLEKLEETADDDEYYLMYYTESNEKRNLGKLFNTTVLTETPEEYFKFETETGRICLKRSVGFYYKPCEQEGDSMTPDVELKTIVIPKEYNGHPVLEIGGIVSEETSEKGDKWYYGVNASDVEEIVIPSSVVKLGTSAFRGCRNLKRIVIPVSVKEIGNGAFSEVGLHEIVLPNSIVSIGGHGFSYCYGIQEITIPSSVISVGTDAFLGWTSSQKIYVPFKEGELPEGWSRLWNSWCDAQIIYQE